MGARLLQDVRQDLADVVQVCEGKKKQTNYLRTLINELVKGARSLPRGRVPAGRARAPQELVLSLRWFPERLRSTGSTHLCRLGGNTGGGGPGVSTGPEGLRGSSTEPLACWAPPGCLWDSSPCGHLGGGTRSGRTPGPRLQGFCPGAGPITRCPPA